MRTLKDHPSKCFGSEKTLHSCYSFYCKILIYACINPRNTTLPHLDFSPVKPISALFQRSISSHLSLCSFHLGLIKNKRNLKTDSLEPGQNGSVGWALRKATDACFFLSLCLSPPAPHICLGWGFLKNEENWLTWIVLKNLW